MDADSGDKLEFHRCVLLVIGVSNKLLAPVGTVVSMQCCVYDSNSSKALAFAKGTSPLAGSYFPSSQSRLFFSKSKQEHQSGALLLRRSDQGEVSIGFHGWIMI